MGKKVTTRTKITSSGSKAKARVRRNEYLAKRTPNMGTGENPHTKKEFLIIDPNGRLPKVVGSYQTRVGALQNKPEGHMIILKSNLGSKIRQWENLKKSHARRIDSLNSKKNQIQTAKKKDKASTSKGAYDARIANITDEINRLKKFKYFDVSELKSYLSSSGNEN